jgi:hypothetical protein
MRHAASLVSTTRREARFSAVPDIPTPRTRADFDANPPSEVKSEAPSATAPATASTAPPVRPRRRRRRPRAILRHRSPSFDHRRRRRRRAFPPSHPHGRAALTPEPPVRTQAPKDETPAAKRGAQAEPVTAREGARPRRRRGFILLVRARRDATPSPTRRRARARPPRAPSRGAKETPSDASARAGGGRAIERSSVLFPRRKTVSCPSSDEARARTRRGEEAADFFFLRDRRSRGLFCFFPPPTSREAAGRATANRRPDGASVGSRRRGLRTCVRVRVVERVARRGRVDGDRLTPAPPRRGCDQNALDATSMFFFFFFFVYGDATPGFGDSRNRPRRAAAPSPRVASRRPRSARPRENARAAVFVRSARAFRARAPRRARAPVGATSAKCSITRRTTRVVCETSIPLTAAFFFSSSPRRRQEAQGDEMDGLGGEEVLQRAQGTPRAAGENRTREHSRVHADASCFGPAASRSGPAEPKRAFGFFFSPSNADTLQSMFWSERRRSSRASPPLARRLLSLTRSASPLTGRRFELR